VALQWRPACVRKNRLIIIDMQTDFCGVGGYVDTMGYDPVAHARADRKIKRLLAVMRTQGFHIIHTREGHRPDLQIAAKSAGRSRQSAPESADTGHAEVMVRGEAGLEIIPDWRRCGRTHHRQEGQGSFCATDLELMLRAGGVSRTWCIDRSPPIGRVQPRWGGQRPRFECVLDRGCCRHDRAIHDHALKMIKNKMQGGVFGAV